MFADGFLSISLEGLLGLIVAILGIWYIAKQLNETRLATQMEGLLSITDRTTAIRNEFALIRELGATDDWKNMTNVEAYEYLMDSAPHRDAYNRVLFLTETVSVLVRRKALDRGIAWDMFGEATEYIWTLVEKVVKQERITEESPGICENFEWLVEEYRAYAE